MTLESESGRNYYGASSATPVMVSVSVVSHGHGELVQQLLKDLARCNAVPLEIILTQNVSEPISLGAAQESLKISVCQNTRPKGFAANHNTAFRASKGAYFCVLNPDVRLPQDPFPQLLSGLKDPDIGLIAPRVVDPEGRTEDNARRFPTLKSLCGKALGISGRLNYAKTTKPLEPDWVAGMFMLFKAEAFRKVGGFDERYFLYYEDVDICARLGTMGFRIRLDPTITVIHDARRESHRNPAYLAWHLQSMLRFLFTELRKLPPLP